MNAADGIQIRKGYGWQVVASFDNVVEELKVRNGRLTAKVNGIWHIIPDQPNNREVR